jgi:hypothetical protein
MRCFMQLSTTKTRDAIHLFVHDNWILCLSLYVTGQRRRGEYSREQRQFGPSPLPAPARSPVFALSSRIFAPVLEDKGKNHPAKDDFHVAAPPNFDQTFRYS